MKTAVVAALAGCLSFFLNAEMADAGLREAERTPVPPAESIPAPPVDLPSTEAPVVEPLKPHSVAESKTEDAKSEQEEWSVAGEWQVKHPAWAGKLIIREDGTFMRPHGDGGRWILSGDQSRVILVLRWTNWGTESLAMVNGDFFKGKIRRGPIEFRRISSVAEAHAEQGKLLILSAMYGVDDRRVDVTRELQALAKDGKITLKPNWHIGTIDPAVGEVKNLIVQYRADGRDRTARFTQEDALTLPKE